MSVQTRPSGPAAVTELSSAQPVVTRKRHVRVVDASPPPPKPRRHNLPHLPSSFVGRQGEVADVRALLAATRLVTLTGPGGMGKTRLGIEAAMGLIPDFADGVWLIELAQLSDPAQLPEAVAAVLLGSQRSGPQSADHVASHIGDQCILLVLDDCEHLVEPCGQMVDLLLRTCPRLSVLATSREPLGVSGEQRWAVGALSLPDRTPADAASVRASGAGELFLKRARANIPGFRLTEALAPTVAEICERLDGMPLAIELAAARLATLSPTDLLERLDDRFRLLTTRSRTVPPRHQALAATLEWSHDLLSPAEAALLRRVSVFSGWTLQAAQAVCVGGEVRPGDMLDLLEALASKSLVIVDTTDDRVRYGLLQTVRAWVREKLDAAPEADEVTRRHASWCLGVAEQADDELRDSQPDVWLDRLEAEHGNLRTALERARTNRDPELGVRLTTAVAPFWRTRGHLGEGGTWLEWAVTASEECPPSLRAKLLRETGLFRGMLGDMTSALPLLEESSALFAEVGDHGASVCACNSIIHMFENPRQSLPGLMRDIERCRPTGDENKLAHFLWALGQAQFLLGDVAEAQRHFEECVQLGRGQPDGEALRTGLFGLGRVRVLQGQPGAARAAFAEAKARAEDLADVDHVATSLVLLGDLARIEGDLPLSRQLLDESLQLRNADGTLVDESRALYFAARLAAAESTGSDNDAGDLFAKALSLARSGGGLGFHEVRCLLGLGAAAAANGHRPSATGHFLEALTMAQTIGDSQATAQAFDRLGALARLDGNLDEADALAHRGLELHHRIGDVAGTAASLESVAAVAVDGQHWQLAARLLSAGQALLETAGYARSGPDQTRWECDLAQARAALGDGFAQAWEEGASLSADDAVTYAMKGRGVRDRPASGWDSLTPAERQVAGLVGEGLTNPEVGRRLFISARTVGHHLTHTYQKLGIDSRRALIKELAGIEGPG